VRRREVITLAASAAAWPFAVRAQSGKMPTIGFLGAATPAAWSEWVVAFSQRSRELGWAEGRTVSIEYRWAEGRPDRIAEIAAEFVRLKVDIIFAPVTVTAVAAKEATSTIPIVFALVGEPVGIGLVASLARPGGNVTGTSNQSTDLGGKRLDFVREVVTGLRRFAILVNVGNPANCSREP
jgi:putative ABC transport system substrate-binding protein